MPLLSPAQLIDVPVVCGAAGQIVVQRALHQEPPHIDSRELARMLIARAGIPVGIITALLGGPFFVWLLLRGSSERSLV